LAGFTTRLLADGVVIKKGTTMKPFRKHSCHYGFLGILALTALNSGNPLAWAVNVTVANPSFELPTFADGGYASYVDQGGHGWGLGDGTGIYNPPAADYPGAGGGGTPVGADGPQVGWVAGFGEYVIIQRLAGADGILDNADDPKLEPFTIYTLKVSVAQRGPGNTFATVNGGYDIQLRAGVNAAAPIVARETDAVTLTPGAFVERTIVWDSALADPAVLGQPLLIILKKTIQGTFTCTDFDNVSLDATFVPPTADFNNSGAVNSVDLTTWKTNFGTSGSATKMQGDADRSQSVDGGDFLLWQRQLGAGAATATPEPTAAALGLLGLGGCALALRRRRARSA
jgi:hypothetical protein